MTENTGLSVTISWLIPYIASSPEIYSIQYGTDEGNLNIETAVYSGDNTSIINQLYSKTLQDLTYVTTYYFIMRVENDIGSVRVGPLTFTTAEGGMCACVKLRHIS